MPTVLDRCTDMPALCREGGVTDLPRETSPCRMSVGEQPSLHRVFGHFHNSICSFRDRGSEQCVYDAFETCAANLNKS